MRLALIARADDGGIGNQTAEIARHLRLQRTVIIDARNADRGVLHPERFEPYTEILHVPYPPGWRRPAIKWLLDGAEGLLTVEGFYGDDLIDFARNAGVAVYVMANPELYPPHYAKLADRGRLRVLAPTSWETQRLGLHKRLDMPVARDRIPFRLRTQVRTVLHPSAPAMEDRNGTDLVLAAAERYRGTQIELLISGPRAPKRTIRNIRCTVRGVPAVEDYWAMYDQADALLIPRRYGGLSLVQQEAMAAGMPIISLDRAPERDWVPDATRVPVKSERPHPMKGGQIPIATAVPAAIATKLAELACGQLDVGLLSAHSDVYADRISWAAMLPEWKETLAWTSPPTPSLPTG